MSSKTWGQGCVISARDRRHIQSGKIKILHWRSLSFMVICVDLRLKIRDFALQQQGFVLHRGEAEAIALAKEIGADIIILDDNLARSAARTGGLNVVGTLGLLRQAMVKGLVTELKPLLDNPKSAGFYMGGEYYEILEDAGEV